MSQGQHGTARSHFLISASAASGAREDTSAQGLRQGELESIQGSWERDEQDPLEALPVGVDGSGGVGVQVMNSQLTSPTLLPTCSARREAADVFQLSVL